MRDYDPTTRRYIEVDRLGLVDGGSVYGYAEQNPGRWIDPRGLRVDPTADPNDPSGGSTKNASENDQCEFDEDIQTAGLKDICAGTWLFICSMMNEMDRDPNNNNSRYGQNPHSKSTSPPPEREYASQPIDPAQKNGGGGARTGGGGGGGFDPWNIGGGGDPLIPKDPLDLN